LYRDSILDLGSGFAIDKASKFRGQNVEIEIKIPVGKKILFDESLENKLNEVSFKRSNRRWPRNGWNYDFDEARRWRTGVEFTMGSDGVLTSNGSTINKSSRPANGEYRYQDNNIQTKPATDDIQRQIEEERQRKKEAEDRIKQLEKQKTEEQKSNTNNPESIDDKEDDVAMSSPSPVFSLMKSFF